jgi:hypothetical protein
MSSENGIPAESTQQDTSPTHITVTVEDWSEFVGWAKRCLGPETIAVMESKLKAKAQHLMKV